MIVFLLNFYHFTALISVAAGLRANDDVLVCFLLIYFFYFKGVCSSDGADNAVRRYSGRPRPRIHHLLPVLAWNAPKGVQLVKTHSSYDSRLVRPVEILLIPVQLMLFYAIFRKHPHIFTIVLQVNMKPSAV